MEPKLSAVLETCAVDPSLVEAFTDRIASSFDVGWASVSVYSGTRVPYLGILRTVGQQEYEKLSLSEEVPPVDVIAFDMAGTGASSYLIEIASRHNDTLPQSYSLSDKKIGSSALLRPFTMNALDLPNWRINASDKFARHVARTECERVIQASMLGE